MKLTTHLRQFHRDFGFCVLVNRLKNGKLLVLPVKKKEAQPALQLLAPLSDTRCKLP